MSIELQVKKTLGDFTLDVSFAAENEVLALLGDSGCGKSMTLRCIAGIVRPDEGFIRINGTTVFDSRNKIDLKPQKRRVGYLFQNYALFPNMTVVQNILAGMEREKGKSRVERRAAVDEYIHRLHLDGLEKHYPSQLSGGQQQRVSLARILASKPDLLLLDEPFSALDAALRWEMEQVVRETIQGFPGTTLLVTHDRDEAFRLSNRVAVYHPGGIDMLGERWEVFHNPGTVTAARLTGCKNIAAVRAKGARAAAPEWGITLTLPEGCGPVDAVGIRSHDMECVTQPGENTFPCQVVQTIADSFNYILMLRPREAGEDTIPLRWEITREQYAALPEQWFIRLPKEKLMLLRK